MWPPENRAHARSLYRTPRLPARSMSHLASNTISIGSARCPKRKKGGQQPKKQTLQRHGQQGLDVYLTDSGHEFESASRLMPAIGCRAEVRTARRVASNEIQEFRQRPVEVDFLNQTHWFIALRTQVFLIATAASLVSQAHHPHHAVHLLHNYTHPSPPFGELYGQARRLQARPRAIQVQSSFSTPGPCTCKRSGKAPHGILASNLLRAQEPLLF